MKKLMICIFLMGWSCVATAVVKNQSAPLYEVKLHINDEQYEKNKLLKQTSIQNKIQLTANEHDWKIIGREQSDQHHYLWLFLSKLEKLDKNTATLKFMLMDLRPEKNFISEPQMLVRYGQVAELNLMQQDHKLHLTVQVTPVNK